MTRQVRHDAVQRWLDDAASAMAGGSSRRKDALLELETSICERLDERAAEGPVSDEVVSDVLELMGDPVEVGCSMAPAEPLIASHQTRTFLVNVATVFAVHFLFVIGATLAEKEWFLPLLDIRPIPDPKNLLVLFERALGTLVFDLGLVLCAYVLFRRVGRIVRFPTTALTVRPDARRCLAGAFFLALVLVVVNFLRDDLLALYVSGETGLRQVPLVGSGIVDNLLLLNVWLGLSIGRELLYALLGERKLTLLLDLAASGAGLFCLLRIVASRRLVDLSAAHEALGPSADGIGAVLNAAFVLIALTAAAMLAVRTVQRIFRLALLRSWRTP